VTLDKLHSPHTTRTMSGNQSNENKAAIKDEEELNLESELERLRCSMTLDSSFTFKAEDGVKELATPHKDPVIFDAVDESNEIQERTIDEALSNLISTDSDDIRHWVTRVENESFYESNFRPVPREIREIEDLALQYLSKGRSASKDLLHPYLMPSQEDPKSVLLKREPVIFNKYDATEVGIGHLILLNRCFFIALDNSQPDQAHSVQGFRKNLTKGFNVLIGKDMRYACCHPLTSIISIHETDAGTCQTEESLLSSFVIGIIQLGKPISYKIHCHSKERQKAWLDALRTSVSMNYGFDKESIFSAILFNDRHQLQNALEVNKAGIDIQDQYHGYSALHLSILSNRLDFARNLLEAGALTITVAKDGSTPLIIGKYPTSAHLL